MSELKLTNEKMKTFDGQDKIKALKAAEKLTEFGERQNEANELLAANINELIKRVCALEDKQVVHEDILKKIAVELSAVKKDVDRLRLSDKLNSNTIKRLDKAIALAGGDAADSGKEE